MLNKRLVLALLLVGLVGCESTYYGAWEKLGVHKRDIMVDRIEDVRESQQDVKEQFSSALERFTAELNFNGGELETVYKALNSEYEDSRSEADTLSQRIDAVEGVAQALFDEWQVELDQYSSASLRRQSAEQLKQTRRQYAQMLSAMHNAERKMAPVLDTLQDQVLFLKHNLNARAIASLKTEFKGLKKDIQRLIGDMEHSIQAADTFLATLKQS
jgi:hypothetical protein